MPVFIVKPTVNTQKPTKAELLLSMHSYQVLPLVIPLTGYVYGLDNLVHILKEFMFYVLL